MSLPRVEQFAAGLSQSTKDSVRSACQRVTFARESTLHEVFLDVDETRRSAGAIKSFVLDHLAELLSELEGRCLASGIRAHWCRNAGEARELIIGLCRKNCRVSKSIVKAKSMVTEEIGLNEALIESGFEPVETDLGEFVVQIDGDKPSHIVAPIIHKDRIQVARSFQRCGLGDYTEEPAELTMQARTHLRGKFREAEVGISGVNFAVAESGRLVLVENEGNNRFSTTAPRVHIAVMGIEKVVPRDEHLGLFLRLLAGSATGQRCTVYTHFIRGPKQSDELDGPEEVHLVLLDNGRSRVASTEFRDILRCLRCGACLNVCPVYRQASGHAYGHVYSGPVGAVLAPAMEGIDKHADLPKASTLCGACQSVCPVDIPIPDMLLRLRRDAARLGSKSDVPWKTFAWAASRPSLWRTILKLAPIGAKFSVGPIAKWRQWRELPRASALNFRRWWHQRKG